MVDRGAKSAQSPESVASQTDTILMSLPTPEVVNNVALGANGIIAGSKIKTLVDLSTTGPHVAQELAMKLSENEINNSNNRWYCLLFMYRMQNNPNKKSINGSLFPEQSIPTPKMDIKIDVKI